MKDLIEMKFEMLLQGITKKHTFVALTPFPSIIEIGSSMAQQRQLVESLSFRSFMPSYGMQSQSLNPIFIKISMYMTSQELSSSIRITNTKWFTIDEVKTNEDIMLGISFTFFLSQNPRICVSSLYLPVAANDLKDPCVNCCLSYSPLLVGSTSIGKTAR